MQTVDLHPKILLFYSELSDGNIDDRFSPAKVVRSNRQSIFSPHKLISREVIEAAQIHSDRLLSLNQENTKMWRGINVTGVDGFVTNQTDAHLMIRVADCFPVVIYDPAHHAVGLFHAGWRGTVKGIHTAGLSRMMKEYQTDPKEVIVWLGPGARACHYVIDHTPEQAEEPLWSTYFSKKGDLFQVDLIGYLTQTLKNAQVPERHIHDSGLCTYESPNLFSHLRAKDTKEPEGRFAVVVKLH